jgi:hypothetical protein
MPPIQPKHIVFAALGLGIAVVAALVIRCGRSRDDVPAPAPENPQPVAISITRDDVLRATEVEAPDPGRPGAFSEYEAAFAESPPPAEGRAAYPSLRNRVVRIAIDSRPSWAALLLRNCGAAPGPAWSAPDGSAFQVELVRIDDPVALLEPVFFIEPAVADTVVDEVAAWAKARKGWISPGLGTRFNPRYMGRLRRRHRGVLWRLF